MQAADAKKGSHLHHRDPCPASGQRGYSQSPGGGTSRQGTLDEEGPGNEAENASELEKEAKLVYYTKEYEIQVIGRAYAIREKRLAEQVHNDHYDYLK